MPFVFPIVEGHGEDEAVGVLVRRIINEMAGKYDFVVRSPHRVGLGTLQKEEKLRNALKYAASKAGAADLILVLIDLDDGCPVLTGARIRHVADDVITHRRVAVVAAVREYETWFLCALNSLRGYRYVRMDASPPINPESRRDSKKWLRSFMEEGKYSPTADQAALTAKMSLEEAMGSRSFRKLVSELCGFAADLAG